MRERPIHVLKPEPVSKRFNVDHAITWHATSAKSAKTDRLAERPLDFLAALYAHDAFEVVVKDVVVARIVLRIVAKSHIASLVPLFVVHSAAIVVDCHGSNGEQ